MDAQEDTQSPSCTWTDKLVRDLANDDETFRQGTSDEKLAPFFSYKEKRACGEYGEEKYQVAAKLYLS